MTAVFKNQNFELFDDRLSGRVFSDIEFIRCRFEGCTFSAINLPNIDAVDMVAVRSTARRIRLTNCDVGMQFLGPGIVEECVLDGLRVHNHFQSRGTAFCRTIVKGSIDKLMLTPYVDSTGGRFADVQRAFDHANEEYYKSVEWALDISEARFKDCDIRGIPARLIKRDPSTQVVLTREKAIKGTWRQIDLSGTHWKVSIELFLQEGHPDCVLVANKRAHNYAALMAGLERLQDAGIAESD